jgi:hypothetical protein
MANLSKKLQALLDEFDTTAKHWGWEEDQGSGRSVITAGARYEEAKAALVKRLVLLETTNKTLRRKLRREVPSTES